MSKTRKKLAYRLNPNELNHLIAEFKLQLSQPAKETKPEIKTIITEDRVVLKDSQHSLDLQVDFFTVEQDTLPKKKYTIFNVTKDSQNKNTEAYLGYICEVIQAFRKQFTRDHDSTLLIPVRQCRGFARLPKFIKPARREHIILVEVDPLGNMHAHDSQSKARYKFYPDEDAEMEQKLGF